MKNLFGFLLKEKDPWPLPEPDGSEFIVKRADEAVKIRLSAMDREDDTVEKTANFPPWLRNLFGILLSVGLFLLGIAIELMGGDGMTYEIAVSCGFWYLIGFGAGLVVISSVFFVLQHFKNKAVMNSTAVKEHESRYERVRREAFDSMLVPQDAVPVDVFTYPYRLKNGKEKSVMPAAKCFANFPLLAFRDGDALCLADPAYVVRIPYDSIVSLSRIRKSTAFMCWNKGENFKKGEFKPYKIRMNSYGQMFVKFCYRLEIRGSETFELIIPPYEFKTLSPMLGYKALSVIDVKR